MNRSFKTVLSISLLLLMSHFCESASAAPILILRVGAVGSPGGGGDVDWTGSGTTSSGNVDFALAPSLLEIGITEANQLMFIVGLEAGTGVLSTVTAGFKIFGPNTCNPDCSPILIGELFSGQLVSGTHEFGLTNSQVAELQNLINLHGPAALHLGSFIRITPNSARADATMLVTSPIPEPASMILLGTGLAAVTTIARKRRIRAK